MLQPRRALTRRELQLLSQETSETKLSRNFRICQNIYGSCLELDRPLPLKAMRVRRAL